MSDRVLHETCHFRIEGAVPLHHSEDLEHVAQVDAEEVALVAHVARAPELPGFAAEPETQDPRPDPEVGAGDRDDGFVLSKDKRGRDGGTYVRLGVLLSEVEVLAVEDALPLLLFGVPARRHHLVHGLVVALPALRLLVALKPVVLVFVINFEADRLEQVVLQRVEFVQSRPPRLQRRQLPRQLAAPLRIRIAAGEPAVVRGSQFFHLEIAAWSE